MKIAVLALLPAAAMAFKRGGSDRGGQGGSIIDKLREEDRFSKFVEVLEKERGLRDDLESKDKQLTLFAPTNEAFENLEQEYGFRFGKGGKGGDSDLDMKQVLQYHVVPDCEINAEDLHGGQLLNTNLKLRSLDDRHQKIRVFKFANTPVLNMQAHVVEQDIQAENGVIHAVDNILIPPKKLTEMMFALPNQFSTWIAAKYRTGLFEDILNEKGITAFVPNNRAWKNLGVQNLKYLFSCVGQEKFSGTRNGGKGEHGGQGGLEWCQGTEDLEKIVEYHIGEELAYTTDIMEEKEVKIKTMEGSSITVKAQQTQKGGKGGHHGGHDSDEDWDDDEDFDDEDNEHHGGKNHRNSGNNGKNHGNNGRNRNGNNRNGNKGRGGRGGDGKKEKCTSGQKTKNFNFVLNNGESRVSFTDLLGKNGVVQVIDNVLIPKDVKLPYERIGFA